MVIPRQRVGELNNRRRLGGGLMVSRRKVCPFCAGKAELVGYKDPVKLRFYISDRGKIDPRRRTGICARHQRVLATAVKRARHLALIPYVPAHVHKTGGVGIRD